MSAESKKLNWSLVLITVVTVLVTAGTKDIYESVKSHGVAWAMTPEAAPSQPLVRLQVRPYVRWSETNGVLWWRSQRYYVGFQIRIENLERANQGRGWLQFYSRNAHLVSWNITESLTPRTAEGVASTSWSSPPGAPREYQRAVEIDLPPPKSFVTFLVIVASDDEFPGNTALEASLLTERALIEGVLQDAQWRKPEDK